MAGTSWTQEEKDVLVEMAGAYTAHEIGQSLGRSTDAVRHRGRKLRLSLKITGAMGPYLKEQDHKLSKKAGIPLRAWAQKRAEGFKWCFKCTSWKSLDSFWKDQKNADGCYTSCCDCNRKSKRTLWSMKERKHLFRLLGTYTAVEISDILGRSPWGIRNFCKNHGLSLRLNADGQFTYGQLKKILKLNQNVFYEWLRKGLKTRKCSRGYNIIKRVSLHKFLQKNPEALDVYALSTETLENLGIKLDVWPEPPTFKFLKCNGYTNAKHGVRVSHQNVWIARSLYEKKSFCPICQLSLKHWAALYGWEWGKEIYIGGGKPHNAEETPVKSPSGRDARSAQIRGVPLKEWMEKTSAGDSKCCRMCGTWKPFEDFYKNKRNPDGRRLDCKKCHSERYRPRKSLLKVPAAETPGGLLEGPEEGEWSPSRLH